MYGWKRQQEKKENTAEKKQPKPRLNYAERWMTLETNLLLFVQKQIQNLSCQLKYKLNNKREQELLSLCGILLAGMT